jgi:hypothetical protein
MGSVVRQYRFIGVLRLTFRVWLRNLIPFTLLSALLSAPLVIWLVLGSRGLGSAELIFSLGHQSYPLLVLRGLTSLLTPMITHRVIQSLDGVDLPLVRSVRLSVHGMLTMLLVTMLGFFLAFLPVLGIIALLCLGCIWFVAIPAAIAEQLKPFAALGRSASLTAPRLWTTIGLMLVASVIAVLPHLAVLVAVRYNFMSGDPRGTGNMMAKLQQLRPYAIALVAMTGVVLPLQGIVRAVSYVLIRRDSTGAHEELAEVFG